MLSSSPVYRLPCLVPVPEDEEDGVPLVGRADVARELGGAAADGLDGVDGHWGRKSLSFITVNVQSCASPPIRSSQKKIS